MYDIFEHLLLLFSDLLSKLTPLYATTKSGSFSITSVRNVRSNSSSSTHECTITHSIASTVPTLTR